MRTSLAVLLCLAGLCQSEWIAAQEQQASPPDATPTAVPANSSAVPAKTPVESAKAGASASSSAQELTVDEQRLLSQGYTLQIRKQGEKYFCKKEPALGSRLDRTLCATAEVILKRMQNDQDITRRAGPGLKPPGH